MRRWFIGSRWCKPSTSPTSLVRRLFLYTFVAFVAQQLHTGGVKVFLLTRGHAAPADGSDLVGEAAAMLDMAPLDIISIFTP